jgi:hypothetical protein
MKHAIDLNFGYASRDARSKNLKLSITHGPLGRIAISNLKHLLYSIRSGATEISPTSFQDLEEMKRLNVAASPAALP